MKNWDVIVIGGGIIGLSLALALRKRGASVLVVERGEPGREASSAAGGMLVESPLETPLVLRPLAAASARMYPEFAHEVEVESGMKVDLRDAGTILLSAESELPAACNATRVEIAEQEPALTKTELHAFYIKERSVDPRGLTQAVVKAAKKRGVDFSSGDEVTSVHVADGRVAGVTTVKTAFTAAKVVNCAGAWSGGIAPLSFPTRAVKGQMLCLAMPSRSLLKHVIRAPQAYLIPRSDGRLLVGATVEEVGFNKRTDPATIENFHRAAIELVPKLADAKILEAWAGLRPGTPDGLPILGQTGVSGYYLATGHFRDGILLAPITAVVMAALIEGRQPDIDVAAFSPHRFD